MISSGSSFYKRFNTEFSPRNGENIKQRQAFGLIKYSMKRYHLSQFLKRLYVCLKGCAGESDLHGKVA